MMKCMTETRDAITWSILTIVYDHMTHSGICTAVITGCVVIGLLMSERHASFLCGAIGLYINSFWILLWWLSTTFEALMNGSYNTALLTIVTDIPCTKVHLQNIFFRHTCNS